MKKLLIFDFFSIIIFFIIYKTNNIYTATFALIIITTIQTSYKIVRYRKLSVINIMTFILIIIFGATTIYFHNEMFIKWKVTIINWLFGITLICSSYLMKNPILQVLIERNIKFSSDIWKIINNIWGVFFIFIGTLNLFISYYCSTEVWVNFKVFGILIISIIFLVGQVIYLAKYNS